MHNMCPSDKQIWNQKLKEISWITAPPLGVQRWLNMVHVVVDAHKIGAMFTPLNKPAFDSTVALNPAPARVHWAGS